MDNFIKLAQKGYEAYQDSQSPQGQGQGHNQSNQGGQGYQQGGQGHQQGEQGYQQGGQGGRGGQGGQGYGGSQQGYQQSDIQGGYGQDNQGGFNQSSQGYGQGSSGQSNQGGYGGNQGQYGHNQPSGGFGSQGPDLDHDAVVQNAGQHAGGSGDSSLFGSAMSFLNQNQSQHTQPIDEQGVQNAHDQAYQKGNASSLDAGSLGSAAAMQVLKNFTSGGGSSGGSGNTQSQLISMAMAEAAKLFDSQGGSASGGKQDAVNGAAMTVMKLFVQSKMGGAQTTGGANSGGLGQLMGLASQFMK